MEAQMNQLRLELPSPQAKALASHAEKQNKVADSWEDDDISDRETGLRTPTRDINLPSPDGRDLDPAFNPPPPTPMSPRSDGGYIDWAPASKLGGGRPQTHEAKAATHSWRGDVEQDRRRPETTTSTANRMISASLGLKAPKKTEEQIKYDRAVKEQEIKKRNKEKEQKQQELEENEKLKTAVWEG